MGRLTWNFRVGGLTKQLSLDVPDLPTALEILRLWSAAAGDAVSVYYVVFEG